MSSHPISHPIEANGYTYAHYASPICVQAPSPRRDYTTKWLVDDFEEAAATIMTCWRAKLHQAHLIELGTLHPVPKATLPISSTYARSELQRIADTQLELESFIKNNFPSPRAGETPPPFPPNLFNVSPTPSPTAKSASPVQPPMSQIPSMRSEKSVLRSSWPDSFRNTKRSIILPVPKKVAEFDAMPGSKTIGESKTLSGWMGESRTSWDSKLILSFLPLRSITTKSDHKFKRESGGSVNSRILSYREPLVTGSGSRPALPPLSPVISEIRKQHESDASVIGSTASRTISLNNVSISNLTTETSASTGETLIESQGRTSLPSLSLVISEIRKQRESDASVIGSTATRTISLNNVSISNLTTETSASTGETLIESQGRTSLPPISKFFESRKADEFSSLQPTMPRLKPLGPPPTLIMPKSDGVVDTWSQILRDEEDVVPQAEIDACATSGGSCTCSHCRSLGRHLTEWLEEDERGCHVVCKGRITYDPGVVHRDDCDSNKENIPPPYSVASRVNNIQGKSFGVRPRRLTAGVLQQLIEREHPSPDSLHPFQRTRSDEGTDLKQVVDSEAKDPYGREPSSGFPVSLCLDFIEQRLPPPETSPTPTPRRKRVDSRITLPNLLKVGRKVSKIFNPYQW